MSVSGLSTAINGLGCNIVYSMQPSRIPVLPISSCNGMFPQINPTFLLLKPCDLMMVKLVANNGIAIMGNQYRVGICSKGIDNPMILMMGRAIILRSSILRLYPLVRDECINRANSITASSDNPNDMLWNRMVDSAVINASR